MIEMARQIKEGRRREAASLAETAGPRWSSEVDEHGNQQFVTWGDIPVEIAEDPAPQTGGSLAYLALLDKMADLHREKNAGYAGIGNPDPWRNFRMAEEFGVAAWRGALIRASDKWSRIISLLENPDNEQVGESVEDTLFDLAAYCLIVICLRQELWG